MMTDGIYHCIHSKKVKEVLACLEIKWTLPALVIYFPCALNLVQNLDLYVKKYSSMIA